MLRYFIAGWSLLYFVFLTSSIINVECSPCLDPQRSVSFASQTKSTSNVLYTFVWCALRQVPTDNSSSIKTVKPTRCFKGHTSSVQSVAASPSGMQVSQSAKSNTGIDLHKCSL